LKPTQETADHRRAERFTLKLAARVRPVSRDDVDVKEALELVTSDVCCGGAYFQTDSPLSLGTKVTIDLVLPLEKLKTIEGKQTHIRVSGHVIRATEKGMAISFGEDSVISPWPTQDNQGLRSRAKKMKLAN
jgi:hypothetical protein